MRNEQQKPVNCRGTIVRRKAVEMVREGYQLTMRLPETEIYGMRPQFTRAAVSIRTNVAEVWTREWHKEKAQFFAIAHGSEVEMLVTIANRLDSSGSRHPESSVYNSRA